MLAHRHEAMVRGQAERLFPLIETVVDDARLTLRDIDALAVGTGPGNFTGLRISVAAVRGLALALGRPALGVPDLEALAYGLPRPVLTAVAAPRGQVHLQRFGDAPMGPATVDPEAPSGDWAAPGLTVAGHASGPLADRLGARDIAPAPPAIAVARTATHMLAAHPGRTDWPRPAPLYLRPADAAPPSEGRPVILPS